MNRGLQLPIVFLGLSLTAEEGRHLLHADYRRPIEKGDLDAISPPATVLIIDGILGDRRLPPSEAVRALERGVRLYGAASTGALLAIELLRDGMVGMGRVFKFLHRFPGDREDLVALLYLEKKQQPVTVPLINIILACIDAGMAPPQLKKLMCLLTSIPLHKRTWTTIETACSASGLTLPHSIRTFDVKKEDASSLLDSFREEVSSPV